jgi:hypothetical protein
MADGNNASPKRGGRKRPTPKAKAAGRGAPKRRKRSTAPPKTKAAKRVARGGSTPAVAAAKRVKRNREMYVSWRRGIDATTLAERHDVTPRRVRQIVDDLAASSLVAYEPDHVLTALKDIDRLINQMERAITDAADIQQKAIDVKNYNVALGASRRVAEARQELLALKQDRGIIPRNLAYLKAQWDTIEIAATLIEILERHDLPQGAKDEIAAAVRLHTRTDQGRTELDMRTGLDAEQDA